MNYNIIELNKILIENLKDYNFDKLKQALNECGTIFIVIKGYGFLLYTTRKSLVALFFINTTLFQI